MKCLNGIDPSKRRAIYGGNIIDTPLHSLLLTLRAITINPQNNELFNLNFQLNFKVVYLSTSYTGANKNAECLL